MIALVLININSILKLDALKKPLLERGLGSCYLPSPESEGPKKREKNTIQIVKGASISDSESGLNLQKKGSKSVPLAFFFVWLVLRTVFSTFSGEICVKVKIFLRLGHL